MPTRRYPHDPYALSLICCYMAKLEQNPVYLKVLFTLLEFIDFCCVVFAFAKDPSRMGVVAEDIPSEFILETHPHPRCTFLPQGPSRPILRPPLPVSHPPTCHASQHSIITGYLLLGLLSTLGPYRKTALFKSLSFIMRGAVFAPLPAPVYEAIKIFPDSLRCDSQGTGLLPLCFLFLFFRCALKVFFYASIGSL